MLITCLRIAGVLLILLATAHVTFPKRFQWAQELARLSLLNRQMFLVHVGYIVYLVASMGLLSLFFTRALIEQSLLARLVLAWLFLFWFSRLFVQWLVYDQSLWRGNRFHTAVHFIFTGMWMYLSAVYGWALWRQFL
ncbi:MAG: hypothetical protein WD669_10785 [Pirellulales bacterium]